MQFERDGLVFDVRQAGPLDGEPVVLLHGFPETSASWDEVMVALAGDGYRAMAPDQRGYSPGARPDGIGAYRVEQLAADVVALLDDIGAPAAHIVGHDWGGIVAWHLAGTRPDRVRTLTSVSTPHPSAFQRVLLTSTQALHSTYMLFFQLPAIPERVLLARDGAVFRRSLVRSGLRDDAVDRYLEHMQEPGAMTAALNWYRALRLRPSVAPA